MSLRSLCKTRYLGNDVASILGGGGGSGDVVGPASATDNALARFDTATGKLIQDSKVVVGDDGQTVITTSNINGFNLIRYGDYTQIIAGRANGVEGAPTAILSDQTLGSFDVGGFDGTSTTVNHLMHGISTEDRSTGNQGAKTVLYSTANGTTAGAAFLTGNQDQTSEFANDVTIKATVASARTITSVAASAGGGTGFKFEDGGITPTKTNWLIGAQINVNNGFEITPSTAVGGDTFTTPAVSILPNGNVGIGITPTAPLHVEADNNTTPNTNGIVIEQSTAGAYDSVLHLRTSSSTTGDPMISLNKSGTTGWSIGEDTTNQTFVISRAWNSLSSSPTMTIEGTGAGTNVNWYAPSNQPLNHYWYDGTVARVALAMQADNHFGIWTKNLAGTGWIERFTINNDVDTATIGMAGNLTVSGSLSKGSGSFKIDHPLPAKTETHNLVHSFVEAPQADNIYRGTVTLVDGSATVDIDSVSGMSDGTFVLLNGNTQCFTTNETDWDNVKGSVSGNTLTISCENASSTATVSWMVIGERIDQHMIDTEWTDENGKVIVEPEKTVIYLK